MKIRLKRNKKKNRKINLLKNKITGYIIGKLVMAKWIQKRLKEPSSARAIVGFLSALGLAIEPALIEQIITIAISCLSLIEFVRKEHEDDEE